MLLVRFSRVSSLAALVALLGLACNRQPEPEPGADTGPAEDAASPVEPEASLDSTEEIDRKLELYVVCLDRSATRMSDSWKRYTQDVDPETGKPRRRKQAPFLYRIDKELAPCRKAAERGPGWKPALPEIEAALEDYVKTAEAFADHTQTLDTYYREEGFRKDNWQKGADTAAPFADAYAKWDAARERLQALVHSKKDEVDVQLLEQIERTEGKGLRYLTQRFLVDAKSYVRCVLATTGEATRGEATGCAEEHEAQRGSYDAFAARVAAAPQETKQVFWMVSFAESAASFEAEVARVRAAKGRKVEESRQRLRQAHADLTRAAANLRFDFPSAKPGTAK